MKLVKGTFGTGSSAIFDNINGLWLPIDTVDNESKYEATEQDLSWAKRVAEQTIHEYSVTEIELVDIESTLKAVQDLKEEDIFRSMETVQDLKEERLKTLTSKDFDINSIYINPNAQVKK